MKHRSVDLDILVVIILTGFAVVLAFIVPSNWLPLRILALPLVLVLPGYALTCALLHGQAMGIAERLVFSLGLSLSIVILGGLVLNLTPFGLQAGSWAVFLGGITLVASAVAFVQRRGQSGAASDRSGFGGIGLTFRQGLLLGLAALVVGAAFAVSIIGAQQQPRPGFTQLWILPAGGTGNAKNAVRLGVQNMEAEAREYILIVDVNGQVVKVWPAIDLAPNEQWEATLVLPQPGHVSSGSTQVEALLYLAHSPTTAYRHVLLSLGTT